MVRGREREEWGERDGGRGKREMRREKDMQNRRGGGEEGKGERDREKKSEERRRRRQIYIFPVARYPESYH